MYLKTAQKGIIGNIQQFQSLRGIESSRVDIYLQLYLHGYVYILNQQIVNLMSFDLEVPHPINIFIAANMAIFVRLDISHLEHEIIYENCKNTFSIQLDGHPLYY